MPGLFRLTILPYLQTWDRGTRTLTVNVVLYPIGDPRQSLTAGFGVDGPAIADASIVLRANLSHPAGQLPMHTAVDATIDLPLIMPAGRGELFDSLAAVFEPTGIELPTVLSAGTTLSKYLTLGYRNAFAFIRPRTPRALIDNSFRCMLGCPPPVMHAPHPAPARTWAEVFAIALRVPPVMRRAGLLHTVQVALPDDHFYSSGGWLFFTLSPDSDYADAAGLAGFARSYATRVPALDTAHARPVFTAVLFPVFANPAAASAQSAKYDSVFPEAITFDDGFCKIVHATQLKGMEHLDEDGSGPPPVLEQGVQLGWDDEDVLIGQNRQMGLEPDGSDPADAPRGVGRLSRGRAPSGRYRLDVAQRGTHGSSNGRRVRCGSVRRRTAHGSAPAPHLRPLLAAGVLCELERTIDGGVDVRR